MMACVGGVVMAANEDGSHLSESTGASAARLAAEAAPGGGTAGFPAAPASRRRQTRVRWAIVWLCFTGTAINYVDRANLSIAAPFIQREFRLSDAAMGLILGS